MAEPATDLANAILRLPNWNPSELFLPLSEMLPAKISLPDDILFEIGKELAVNIPVDGHGKSECFNGDKLTQTVNMPGSDNVFRGERAVLLAIHILAQPLLDMEPMPQETMATMAKLLAEASMEETKIMLGWLLNFRTLIISLPDNKAIAWANKITSMLEEGKTNAKRLERYIG
jgi:hypothetical protein